MKFDVIVGNPPYQIPSIQRERSDKNLWLKFVDFGYSYLNENGKLLYITPSPIGKHQRSKKANYSVFLDSQVDFVKLLTNKEASTFFPGVGSKFSYYTISKIKKHNGANIIIGANSTNIDLKNVVISPSSDKPGILEFFSIVNNATKLKVYSNYEGHGQNLGDSDYSIEKTDQHPYRFYITNKKRVYCKHKHSLYNIPKVVLFLFSALKDVEYNDELGFGENLKYIPVKNREDGAKLVKMLNSKFYRYYSDNFRSGRALNIKGIPYYPWEQYECDNQLYDYFNVSDKLRKEIETVYEV